MFLLPEKAGGESRPLKAHSLAKGICYAYAKARPAMAADLGPSYGSAWLAPISEPPVFTSPKI
jgi:hypothetical protein